MRITKSAGRRNYILVLALTALMTGLSCGDQTLGLAKEPTTTPTPPPAPAPPLTTRTDEPVDPRFHEALRLWVAGEREDAVRLMRALADEKEEGYLYGRVAEWYEDLGQYTDAVDYLRKALVKDPDDPIAHWRLAKILVRKLGQYEDGIKEAEVAQRLYGSGGSPYIQDELMGEAYDKLGNYDSAVAHYRVYLKGISHAPTSNDYKRVSARVKELEKLH